MEWFVLKNGDVLGPYETNSVAQMFGSEVDVLIWGVPHQEWLSFADWAEKMNMGAVAKQSASFRRGHSQVHHSQEAPVNESYVVRSQEPPHAQYQPEPLEVEDPQSSQAIKHEDQILESQVPHAVGQSTQAAPPEQPVVSAYSQSIPESTAGYQQRGTTDHAHSVESEDFNPDATAVYVQPSGDEIPEDDGRTVISSTDLPLEIPNEEDMGNVIHLHQESRQEADPQHESYSDQDEEPDAVEDLESVLGSANEQLDAVVDIDEVIAEPDHHEPEQVVAKQNVYDEDQGTVDLEQMLEDQPEETGESYDSDIDEEEGATRVSASLSDLDDEEVDEEGATRVSASLSDLDEEEEDEEGATRVSASLSDLDDEEEDEEGATRVSASMDLSGSDAEEDSDVDADLVSILGDAVSSPSQEEAINDDELDLSFSGQTQVTETGLDIASLLDTDVQARSEEESEDHNFDFDGVSQVYEDATRIETLADMENMPTGRESDEDEPESLEWSGQAATEEATRVFMEDLAKEEEAQSEPHTEEGLEAEELLVQDEALSAESEEATRVQASDEDEDEDVDVANEAKLQALLNEIDEDDDDEGATSVSKALGVIENSLVSQESDSQEDADDDEAYELDVSELEAEAEEEEATRVNASESSVEDDLSDFEEEITKDVPIEASQDDEEEATRVSASGSAAQEGEDSEYDLEGATRVEDLKVIAHKMNEEKRMQEDFVWYIAYEGESEGPLTMSQVMKSIDDYEVKDFIYLWREGFIDWKNLFDVPELSSGLGIGFRRHSRVQATGTVSVEFEGGVQIGQLDNLSESGIGMTGVDGLHLGDVVKVKLDADDFEESVILVARVRFVSETGLLGLSYEKDKYPENVIKVVDFVKANAEKAAA